uniref:NACHT LRR and PYD domain-containing protein n=1 Tax=Cyprinus carpio TaxID=7962 RepID=A0A8C1UW06_CYPCA
MENRSPEESINLFHCLNELNDRSLEQEVQTYLSRTGASRLSGVKLSAAQWSALVFVLLNSEEDLDEFKLSKYERSEKCLLRLMPVIKASRKANLSSCGITQKGCAALISALRSNPSHLTELNLSYNRPGDSGVKLLSTLLKDPHCKLEKLQLLNCSIGEEGCAALISALRSNPSHLRELNLNNNKPGDSGMKLLSALLEDPHSGFLCGLSDGVPMLLIRFFWEKSFFFFTLCRLSYCSIGEKDCSALISGLRSNPSHLRELNLSCNKLGNSGVKPLSALLEDPHCKLQKLQLVCSDFSSTSNPSHLRELNLSCNKPGDSGVKLLSALQEDPRCKLQKLQ